MRKTIAVDIGNVSIHIEPGAYARALGLTEATPEMRELQRQMEWGELSEDAYFARIAEIFPAFEEATLRRAFDSILQRPVEGMEDLLETLALNQYQVVFFSDISPNHLRGFRQRFRGASNYPGIYSFEVGAWKPSLQMLQAFEQAYGKPELYLDDRLELVEAARNHGWNARQFEGASQVLNWLGISC